MCLNDCRALLKSFKLIALTMKDLEGFFNRNLSDDCVCGDVLADQLVLLWREFFLATVVFITQGDLQLEQFPDAKCQRFLAQYGDMRLAAAAEMRSAWFLLKGDHISID